MKTTLLPLLLVSTALFCITGCQTGNTPPADPKDGRVTVNFQDPEKFTDFKDGFLGTDRAREDYMALLRDCLNRDARPFLAEGQKLTVTFLDVDLAGDFLPMVTRGHDDVRVVTEVYPPRIKLRFELVDASGAVLKQGERKLVDNGFMMRVTLSTQEGLHYEKELLRDWLRAEFK